MAWSSPSPLAGEGGSPRSGETGEGYLSAYGPQAAGLAEATPHPAPWPMRSFGVLKNGGRWPLMPPSPTRGEGKKLSALPFRHAPDLRAERIQPFVDTLVAALDLVGVVDRGGALGADGREQHGHSGANVG